MGRTLTLLRHAQPQVDPLRPPAQWGLSEEGCRSAASLGGEWLEGSVLASSTELKAVQTMELAAQVAAHAITLDDRFGEVRRPGEPFDEHVRARRRAWVEGRSDHRHQGWESPLQAARRFQDSLDDIDAEHLVVATHGMVLTAFLVSIGQLLPHAPAGRFWSDLAFPDVVHVQL